MSWRRSELFILLERPRFSLLHVVLVFFLLVFYWKSQIPVEDVPSFVVQDSPERSPSSWIESQTSSDRSLPAECSAFVPPPTPTSRVVLGQAGSNIGKHKLDFEVNQWGIPMANSVIEVNGKNLTYDDVIYAYDVIFEDMALYSRLSWMGIAMQQDPADAFAIQSLLWRIQPDLLIEIGTNTGGGAVFYASIMREYNPDAKVFTMDPKDPSQDWTSSGKTGCPHCKSVRCNSIWHTHVEFMQGFSHDEKILARVAQLAAASKKILVMQDGSHFAGDVSKDLSLYDRFVTVGSYMVVQDTKMTRMYTPLFKDGYPLTSARQFLEGQGKGRYQIDKTFEYLLYSQHHDGFLMKVAP